MDILIKWDSEWDIRTFLQSHNIVLLSISSHEENIESFGKLEITIKYNNQKTTIISYLTDIRVAIFNFLMIGFDITYINFTDKTKLADSEISNILSEVSSEVRSLQKQVQKTVTQDKENERKIYKDENLEKIVNIAHETFGQIESLLQKVGDRVSQDKIRDLKVMEQELTKLKMWRNDDKMSELLEKIYDKSDAIETEYLDYMQKHIAYPIPDSVVTNIDIITENQKLKKSKKIKEIWADRDVDDNFYLSFEFTGLYAKLLIKDIKHNIQHLSRFFYNLFDYIELAILFLIISTAIILWTKKIYYSSNENLYNYVFLLQTAIFGVVIYYIQRYRKQKIYQNILLLLFAIIISSIIYWLLKTNFSF